MSLTHDINNWFDAYPSSKFFTGISIPHSYTTHPSNHWHLITVQPLRFFNFDRPSLNTIKHDTTKRILHTTPLWLSTKLPWWWSRWWSRHGSQNLVHADFAKCTFLMLVLFKPLPSKIPTSSYIDCIDIIYTSIIIYFNLTLLIFLNCFHSICSAFCQF